METMEISKEEYLKLKEKADLDEGLFIKLIKGLEDIKEGRIKSYPIFP